LLFEASPALAFSQQDFTFTSQQGISQSICIIGAAMAKAIIKTNPMDVMRLSMPEFTPFHPISSKILHKRFSNV
mgnify:CR=1